MCATVMKQRAIVHWPHQKTPVIKKMCDLNSSKVHSGEVQTWRTYPRHKGGAWAICCGSGVSLHDCAVSMTAKSWKRGGSQHFDNLC